MKHSEQINEIATALAIAQGQIMPAEKGSINPFFKCTYSNITSVWESIRDPLSLNNLCVLQDVLTRDEGIAVITRVIHSSGQWIEFGPLVMPVAKKDPQSMGSVTSYARRYALCAALGVVSDDDDGESAMQRNSKQAVVVEKRSVEYASKEGVEELFSILKECSEDDQAKMSEFVKTNYNNDIFKMRAETLIKLKDRALKNKEKYLESVGDSLQKVEEVLNGQ